MTRQRMKQQGGFVLLGTRTHRGEYYHESGTQCIGTPDEREYVNWTRYKDEARRFQKRNEARNMANLLLEKYGERVSVIVYDRGLVF